MFVRRHPDAVEDYRLAEREEVFPAVGVEFAAGDSPARHYSAKQIGFLGCEAREVVKNRHRVLMKGQRKIPPAVVAEQRDLAGVKKCLEAPAKGRFSSPLRP